MGLFIGFFPVFVPLPFISAFLVTEALGRGDDSTATMTGGDVGQPVLRLLSGLADAFGQGAVDG